jgi:hypothetical protein
MGRLVFKQLMRDFFFLGLFFLKKKKLGEYNSQQAEWATRYFAPTSLLSP